MIDRKNEKSALKSIDKIKLFSLCFIFLCFTSKFFIYNNRLLIGLENNVHNTSFYKNSKEIKPIIDEKSKIENDFESLKNYKCLPTNNKIYWKNQIDLEIEKSRDEVRNSKSLKISFENKIDFLKRENPKISIIITIYNQDYYINELYAHIQQQDFKDFEIIFVDDCSTDNTSLVIKELMENDKRIIYLKNEVNKRQYYSIAIGILNSKGEYILSIDPDDYLLNNILIKAYETAKYYDLDIVQYYIFLNNDIWQNKYKSGIICGNRNIRNMFYYGQSRNLPDKLIRRDIYIKAINFMKKELFNEDYHIHTDDTFFFGIIHFANSYCFLEQIGYFYNNNPNRNLKNSIKQDKVVKINKDTKSLFNIMKYFIIQSDNSTIEKNNIPYKFFEKSVQNHLLKNMKYITKDFNFYIDVLNLYLDCPFFNTDKKGKIKKIIRKFTIKKRYYKNVILL